MVYGCPQLGFESSSGYSQFKKAVSYRSQMHYPEWSHASSTHLLVALLRSWSFCYTDTTDKDSCQHASRDDGVNSPKHPAFQAYPRLWLFISSYICTQISQDLQKLTICIHSPILSIGACMRARTRILLAAYPSSRSADVVLPDSFGIIN